MKKLYSTPDFDVSVYELEDTLAGCLSNVTYIVKPEDNSNTPFSDNGWVPI